MATDPAISNGQNSILTPSKLNLKHNETKSYKFKRKIEDTESENEHIDFLYDQLTKEQNNNEFLKKEISEMRSQISELTKTIVELNNSIKKLQSHNKDLLKTKRKDIKNSKNQIEKIEKKTKFQTPTKQNTSSNTQLSETFTTPPNVSLDNQYDQNNRQNTQSNHLQLALTPKNATANPKNETSNTINNIESDNSDQESDEEDQDNTNEQINQPEFNENDRVQRTSKIPPIDIWTGNQQATQTLIRHHMPNYSCIFNKINKTKMRVTTKTVEIRKKLIELLQNRKIQYNTYTPSDDRMQNILLKGTDIDNEDIIIQALGKNGIQPHNIRKFETGFMRKNNIISNVWQITLQPKTDTSTIFKIRYIAEWTVKWELMRKPAITQCRRCQRFNHSASNCTLPYRCVKCINEHSPGECPLDSNNNKTKPTCTNCKGEHTANNARLCPAFKKQLEIKEQRKQTKQKHTTNNRNVNRNTTAPHTDLRPNYANVVKYQTQKYREQETPHKRNEDKSSAYNIHKLLEKNKQSLNNILNAFMESQCEMINAIINTNVTK